jgi:hypothetical protein
MRRLAQAPLTPFIDGRKSVVSHAHTNMRETTEGAEILRSGKRLRRRAIALGHSSRPLRGIPYTPAAASRCSKSVPSTARANMRASIGVTGYRRSGKLPFCATGS